MPSLINASATSLSTIPQVATAAASSSSGIPAVTVTTMMHTVSPSSDYSGTKSPRDRALDPEGPFKNFDRVMNDPRAPDPMNNDQARSGRHLAGAVNPKGHYNLICRGTTYIEVKADEINATLPKSHSHQDTLYTWLMFVTVCQLPFFRGKKECSVQAWGYSNISVATNLRFICGYESNHCICMNRRGKLYTKDKPTVEEEGIEECVFEFNEVGSYYTITNWKYPKQKEVCLRKGKGGGAKRKRRCQESWYLRIKFGNDTIVKTLKTHRKNGLTEDAQFLVASRRAPDSPPINWDPLPRFTSTPSPTSNHKQRPVGPPAFPITTRKPTRKSKTGKKSCGLNLLFNCQEEGAFTLGSRNKIRRPRRKNRRRHRGRGESSQSGRDRANAPFQIEYD